MLEFDACVWGCEVPVGLSVVGISILLPGSDFVDEGLSVGDAAIEGRDVLIVEDVVDSGLTLGTLASVVVKRLLGCDHWSPGFEERCLSAGRSVISSPFQSRQPSRSSG